MQNFLAIQEIPPFPDFSTVLTPFRHFTVVLGPGAVGPTKGGGQDKKLRKNPGKIGKVGEIDFFF